MRSIFSFTRFVQRKRSVSNLTMRLRRNSAYAGSTLSQYSTIGSRATLTNNQTASATRGLECAAGSIVDIHTETRVNTVASDEPVYVNGDQVREIETPIAIAICNEVKTITEKQCQNVDAKVTVSVTTSTDNSRIATENEMTTPLAHNVSRNSYTQVEKNDFSPVDPDDHVIQSSVVKVEPRIFQITTDSGSPYDRLKFVPSTRVIKHVAYEYWQRRTESVSSENNDTVEDDKELFSGVDQKTPRTDTSKSAEIEDPSYATSHHDYTPETIHSGNYDHINPAYLGGDTSSDFSDDFSEDEVYNHVNL